ncbi:hypothetical protein LCGC14_0608480 [marine sediment metagenome]|uniref:Uncharacterized protein n=1 Tax=marine sediment metagenome TaxID=412755 RepID=A0A0F9R8J0_9ZZZZ
MITKKRTKEICPKCGAKLKNNKLDYGTLEITGGGTYYIVTCNECGIKFKEYYKFVYINSKYEDEELEFENPYALFTHSPLGIIEENENKRVVKKAEEDLKKAKMVTKEITEILTILVEDISEDKMGEATKSIKKLGKYKVGVGDTETDEAIAYKFKEMLIEKSGDKKAAADNMNEFYDLLHWSD